jgi:hypothetical protein
MRFTLAAITLFSIGYFLGSGAFGILEFLSGLIWNNSLGKAFHNAVLGFDDANERYDRTSFALLLRRKSAPIAA